MFLLYVCFNKDEKSIHGVIFIFFFSFCFVFSTFTHGFALLPFLLLFSLQLLVFRFCLVILYIWWRVGAWLLMLR